MPNRKNTRKLKSLEERFWANVNKTETCWLWTAATRRGYGLIASGAHGKVTNHAAHRLSWEMHYGPIPEGLQVLHKCDVKGCIRPDHLFVGTQKDNTIDMAQKGRAISPFTVADIRTIRNQYAAGGTSFAKLGALYGVNEITIRYIVHRKRWAHVS